MFEGCNEKITAIMSLTASASLPTTCGISVRSHMQRLTLAQYLILKFEDESIIVGEMLIVNHFSNSNLMLEGRSMTAGA